MQRAAGARRLRRVGLVPHRDRPEARVAGARARPTWFAAHGVEVRDPGESDAGRRSTASRSPVDEFADGLDLALSLGGDGTMLRTVDLVYDAGVPVLGVNVGQLGYLTEVEPDDLDAALERLARGRLRGRRAHDARGRRRVAGPARPGAGGR